MGGWFHSADECNPQDSHTICSQVIIVYGHKVSQLHHNSLLHTRYQWLLGTTEKVAEGFVRVRNSRTDDQGTLGSLSKVLKPFLHLPVDLKMKKGDKKIAGTGPLPQRKKPTVTKRMVSLQKQGDGAWTPLSFLKGFFWWAWCFLGSHSGWGRFRVKTLSIYFLRALRILLHVQTSL